MPAAGSDNEPDDAVRWLTPQERAVWLRLLALTVRLPSALDTELQRDFGLTLFEYTVLAVLSEQPSRTLRMSDIAMLSQGSLSRLSHAAAKLERHGLITRQPSASNGRYTEATLTDAGVARIRAVAPAHVATVRRLVFDALPPDRLDALADAAGAILTRIDPEAATLPSTGFVARP